jgi:hypothetical protein
MVAFLAVNNASIILMGCNAGNKESHHNQPANDQRDQNTHSQARNERVTALVNSGGRGFNSRHAIRSHRIPPKYIVLPVVQKHPGIGFARVLSTYRWIH